MNWKDQIRILEQNEDFDVAIFFMQHIIKENPVDVDAYIFIIFRLMYMIVEGSCYFSNISRTTVSKIKREYYASKKADYIVLVRKYFGEGLVKFGDNAEFLYYAGTAVAMSEWYLGIERKDYEQMLEKAKVLQPRNMIYKWLDYYDISRTSQKDPQILEFLRLLNKENSPIQQELFNKGAIGEYILSMMMHWANRIVRENK